MKIRSSAPRVLLWASLAGSSFAQGTPTSPPTQPPVPPPAQSFPVPVPQEDRPLPAGMDPIENPKRKYALMLGDPAPPFDVREWLLGDPITKLEEGKVYLIHLWATWCDPCVAAMEQLTNLQNEFSSRGLVVIAATSPGKTNTAESVQRFVFNENRPIGFHVAWDRSRKLLDFWLNPAGRTRIPCTFIVDREGTLAFLGHPAEMERPLREIMAGTYDLELAKRNYYDAILAGGLFLEYETMLKEKQYAQAYTLARSIADGSGRQSWATLSNIAWTIVDPQNEPEQKDLALALTAAQRANELVEGKEPTTLDTLARVHYLRGELDDALKFQQQAVDVSILDSTRKQMQATLNTYLAEKNQKK